jgi:hypothetical protein
VNWQDDPEVREAMRAHSVRNRLIRSAIIWTPLFMASLAGALFYVFDTATGGDRGGTWVLVIVLGVLATLFGFQSIQTLLDLRSNPESEAGEVTRRWSRSDSLIMKSHYIRLGKRILRGDADQLFDIKDGDWVEVSFYAHSAVIVKVAKVPKPE